MLSDVGIISPNAVTDIYVLIRKRSFLRTAKHTHYEREKLLVHFVCSLG